MRVENFQRMSRECPASVQIFVNWTNNCRPITDPRLTQPGHMVAHTRGLRLHTRSGRSYFRRPGVAEGQVRRVRRVRPVPVAPEPPVHPPPPAKPPSPPPVRPPAPQPPEVHAASDGLENYVLAMNLGNFRMAHRLAFDNRSTALALLMMTDVADLTDALRRGRNRFKMLASRVHPDRFSNGALRRFAHEGMTKLNEARRLAGQTA